VLSIAFPAGIALDTGRQALYVAQKVPGASVIASSYTGLQSKHVTRFVYSEPTNVAVDVSDGSVFVVETDSFEEPCDPTTDGGLGATYCTSRNLGKISRISCAWSAATTIDGLQPAPFQCCCVGTQWGCTLDCPPPTAPLPPPPPLPPQQPLGMFYNATLVSLSHPERDYSRKVVDNETLLFVGGYIYSGMQVQSWGDPTVITVLPAVRLPSFLPGTPHELSYGNCPLGCGRPSGNDACAMCLHGTFGSGSGVCTQCPVGKYGKATEVAACSACPPGKYSASFGATSCSFCPKGTYCCDGYALGTDNLTLQITTTGGIALPVACPKGTYNPDFGVPHPSSCRGCPAGRYQALPGGIAVSECLACPPGSFSGQDGSWGCTPCPASTAQLTAGSANCTSCALGRFSDRPGALSCTACPLGSSGPAEGGSNAECVGCTPGRYGADAGLEICSLCPNSTINYVQRARSEAACHPCESGRFYTFRNSSAECQACPSVSREDFVDDDDMESYLDGLPVTCRYTLSRGDRLTGVGLGVRIALVASFLVSRGVYLPLRPLSLPRSA
jgi:hypothetical protein